MTDETTNLIINDVLNNLRDVILNAEERQLIIQMIKNDNDIKYVVACEDFIYNISWITAAIAKMSIKVLSKITNMRYNEHHSALEDIQEQQKRLEQRIIDLEKNKD